MAIESFILSAVLVMILVSGIKVAAESERFVVLAAGRFLRLAGPGLLFRLPGSPQQWTRIKLGESGKYLGDGLAEFKGASFPVGVESLRPGETVQIISFEDSKVWVTSDG